jgi:hypothetical protein
MRQAHINLVKFQIDVPDMCILHVMNSISAFPKLETSTGHCGRGPNAVGLPDAKVAYSLGRETDIWRTLTEFWGIRGVDEDLYYSTLV